MLALFPASTNEEAKQNWADIDTVLLFVYGHRCLARQAAANGIPSYTYYFTKDNGRLGAWHSGEEVYLYNNIPADSPLYDVADRALSQTFSRYILNFVRTGDPGGDGLPQWKSGDGSSVLQLGSTVGETAAPYGELIAILDEMQGFH